MEEENKPDYQSPLNSNTAYDKTSVSAVASNDGLDPLFPTKEEIEKLAYGNIILYTALQAKELKGLSWTETLQFAVKHLIEKNNGLQDQIIKTVELSGRPLVIEVRD